MLGTVGGGWEGEASGLGSGVDVNREVKFFNKKKLTGCVGGRGRMGVGGGGG